MVAGSKLRPNNTFVVITTNGYFELLSLLLMAPSWTGPADIPELVLFHVRRGERFYENLASGLCGIGYRGGALGF